MSMNVIYIDTLFFTNLILDYLLLLASGRICSLPLRRLLIAAAAAFGALYSVAAVVWEGGFLSSALIKPAVAAGMVLIAYGKEPRLLRTFVVFLAVSAAFGGAVWAASMMSGSPSTASTGVVTVSFKVLVLSFAVCYAVLTLVFRRVAKTAERQVMTAEIRLNGKSAGFIAMRDTGNELYDPITSCPVMVTEACALKGVFPESALEAKDPVTMLENLSATGLARFRLIPYTSVGVEMGFLPAFRPDELFIDGEKRDNIFIAVSPTRMGSGEYAAVI